MNSILLGAIIAVAIYLMFLKQCQAMDEYGFAVIKGGFQAVSDTFTGKKDNFNAWDDYKNTVSNGWGQLKNTIMR